MPEPGELPLGVMAGIGAADFGGLFARDLAAEGADQGWYAMGLHRRQERIELSTGERGDLLQRARVQHRVEPRIDPRVKLLAFRREEQRAEFVWRQQRRQALAMPVGQRTAGGFDDLQCTGNPRAVARLQAFG